MLGDGEDILFLTFCRLPPLSFTEQSLMGNDGVGILVSLHFSAFRGHVSLA